MLQIPAMLAVFCLVLSAGAAAAQDGGVVVRPFEGRASAKARMAVIRALRDESVSLVATGDVDDSAEELGADPSSADGRTTVSRELEIRAWIEGTIEKNGRVLQATIDVIDASSGSSLGSVEYEGRNPRVLAKRIESRFWRDAGDLIERGSVPEAEPEAEPEQDEEVVEEDEEAREEDDAEERDPYAGEGDDGSGDGVSPFDLTVGIAGVSRSFKYKDDLSGLNTYDLTGPSVAVAAHWYPMAHGDGDGAMAHLGLEVTGHMAFAIDSELGSTTFPTSASGFSLGLRYRVPMGGSELGIVGAYAVRSFEIETVDSEGVELDPGVPAVGYNYLRLGLEANIAVADAWAFGLAAFYLPTLSTGDVEDGAWFPNASATGLEGSMWLSHALSSAFDLVASVSFTRFAYTLDPELEDVDAGRPIAGGATDEYISGQLGMRLSL
jgi:hypothetical protein